MGHYAVCSTHTIVSYNNIMLLVVFVMKVFTKKLCFINASFTTKPSTIMIDESWYRSEISRATIFTKWAFQVFHWKVEKYWVLVRQKNYFTCNSLKRDRVALVGLPPAALGPQNIPHRRTARPELTGALFRYINSLENLQSFLNLTGP